MAVVPVGLFGNLISPRWAVTPVVRILHGRRLPMSMFSRFKNSTTPEFDSFGQFQFVHRQGDTLIPKHSHPEPLAQELSHFLKCIREGAEPVTGGQHAVSVVRTLQRTQTALEGMPGSECGNAQLTPNT